MPAPVAFQYVRAMNAIQAQELLVSLKVSDFPSMSKRDRKEYHDSIKKIAFPNKPKAGPVTMETIVAALSTLPRGGKK